jgi:protein-S-isoprenylcysteine O-methyltransferase Ste14
VTFTVLVGTYGALRDAGAAGFGAGPTLRSGARRVVVVGIVLVVAGVVPYPRSAYALFRTTSPVEPRGMERITRHPFFTGTALVGVAHSLLAHRLTGVVFFGGLALFALAGAWHQDRKLLATRGDEHATFMRRTSLVPFAAIATGRQRLVASELPLGAIALGAGDRVDPRRSRARGDHGARRRVRGARRRGRRHARALQAWQREGLRGRGTAERLLGPALVLLGFVHAAVTLVVFPDVLSELGARGVVGPSRSTRRAASSAPSSSRSSRRCSSCSAG